MKRSLKELARIDTITHLTYIPKIILRIKNWFYFLKNYSGLINETGVYIFRNGFKMKIKRSIDTSTIAVIFIKKDYGVVGDDSIVIDIGANIGAYSIFAACSKNTKIYSYEPMKETYDFLVENIRLNKLEKRIFPFRLGISSEVKKTKLYLSEESPFNSMYQNLYPTKRPKNYEIINCIRLKDVFEKNKIRKCHILKIDCEGAEFEILYGLPEKYFERILRMKIEYHNIDSKEKNIEKLLEFLEKKKFTIERIRRDSERTGVVWLKNQKFR
jgi:FkbM family methyltransferase